MADNGNKMKKQLGDRLNSLGVRYQQQDDVFFVFKGNAEVPAGTFLVVPADNRISYFSAFPFEVVVKRLPDTLIAMNALNDAVPFGRFYFDVNSTDNAIFYDQYLFYPTGNVSEQDIKFVLKNDSDIMNAFGALLSDVNSGKLTVREFARRIK